MPSGAVHPNSFILVSRFSPRLLCLGRRWRTGDRFHPGQLTPVGQRWSSSAVPSNRNSRKGRKRSPVLQGRETMDARFVGIDVSKDKLDVHIRPGGETFVVSRDADGLDELIKRLKPVHAVAIGVEATGGFEQVVG